MQTQGVPNSTSLHMGSTSLRTGSTSLRMGSTSLHRGSTSLHTGSNGQHSLFQGLIPYIPPPPMVHTLGTNEATITLITENAPCWHIPVRLREIY